MPRPAPRVVISAGESSGDVLGADLARELIRRCPGIELAGITGEAMRAAGVASWYSLDALNVMGLSEILAHLPRLARLRRDFHRRIVDWQPDAFIGIDSPEFNLGLAGKLRRRGITAIHYVSPSVWAWRPGRVARIARRLDQLLTLFPFEPALYREHELDCRFVGHPLADRFVDGPDRPGARRALSLAGNDRVIALLPGSRAGEIRRHGRLLADTAVRLRRRHPEAELVMPLARPAHAEMLESIAGDSLDTAGVRRIGGRTADGLAAADVAIAASGTVTLEAFLLECPLVVCYRLAPTTFWLARSLRLVRSEHVALPNILCQQSLVPELLQREATPAALAEAAEAWLDDEPRRRAYRGAAADCRRQLAIDAGASAAAAVLDRLGRSPGA